MPRPEVHHLKTSSMMFEFIVAEVWSRTTSQTNSVLTQPPKRVALTDNICIDDLRFPRQRRRHSTPAFD